MRKVAALAFLLLTLQPFAFARSEVNISVSRPPGAPYFVGAPEFNINAEEFTTLVIRIKATRGGTARLFWATNLDSQMNEPKSIWFYLSRSAGYKEYVFNVKSQNPGWAGFVGQIALLPDGGPEGVEIESARAIPSNPIATVRSAWREFWGPKGREVIGSSINVTPSSAIFGRSVNIYIYWIAGIFFLAVFALTSSYLKAAQKTIFLVIVFWILLTLNSQYNFVNIFFNSFSKYAGKTIEGKRAAAYGREFYGFLTLAKEKLPKEPTSFGLLSMAPNAGLQARIYLIPHVLIENPEKNFPYLLVFHPPADQLAVTRKYSIVAKLDEQAYLMKRTSK